MGLRKRSERMSHAELLRYIDLNPRPRAFQMRMACKNTSNTNKPASPGTDHTKLDHNPKKYKSLVKVISEQKTNSAFKTIYCDWETDKTKHIQKIK